MVGSGRPPRSEIRTARLTVRPVRVSETKSFYDHARIPEVTKNAGFLPQSLVRTRTYLAKSAAEWKKKNPERMTFSILLKSRKTWIGSIELRRIYAGVYEAGIFIHPQFWRNGYATEAAKAVIRWAFRRCGAHRVQASCWVENKPAAWVLSKIGFRKEGRMRGYAKVENELQDDFLFGLTAAD